MQELQEALIFAAGWIKSGRPIDGLAECMQAAAITNNKR